MAIALASSRSTEHVAIPIDVSCHVLATVQTHSRGPSTASLQEVESRLSDAVVGCTVP